LLKRIRLKIEGGVQGVGFRPFIYRLAVECGITGWIRNSPSGVDIEAQGQEWSLSVFRERIRTDLPPAAFITILESSERNLLAESGFEIESSAPGRATAVMMADLATCDDCVEEIFDPENRRHLYPFTNCTNCGPRYSIIKSLPYDRAATSMSGFTMCPRCREEYSNPSDRRFHAQPNACSECGPQVFLRDSAGTVLLRGHDALKETGALLLNGRIVAVKGLGGFHLLARADVDEPVMDLRRRKNRPFKPFAVMVPDSRGITAPPETISLLRSPAAPIVLVCKSLAEGIHLSPSIAPENGAVGIMLPYTPLHHLLMRELSVPVVATSGNRSSEPVCIDGEEALGRLDGIADFFLDHNRPILRSVEDSVVVVSDQGVTPIRRSRGYAPLPVSLPGVRPGRVSLGGNERNTIALSLPGSVIVSQYLGDMTDRMSLEGAARSKEELATIYGIEIMEEFVDLHPDYPVRTLLRGPGTGIQHHHAHVLSCMAENRLNGKVLGVVWDGSGYGPDGTVWGGEFLSVSNFHEYLRVASFRSFPLPGGEKAVLMPPRTAAGMLFAAGIGDPDVIPGIEPGKGVNLIRVLQSGVNCPETSSVGRLFDGVAALLGLCDRNTYSGQAAIALQSSALPTDESYPVLLSGGTFDWVPVLTALLNDIRGGVPPGIISGKFHNWLSDCAVSAALKFADGRVVLTGGCFQNTLLLDSCARKLRTAGFDVYSHHIVPPGDGGLSLGQAAAFSGGE